MQATAITPALMGKKDDIGSNKGSDYLAIAGVAEPNVSAGMSLKSANGITLTSINQFAQYEQQRRSIS
jgi:hypothetical protein